MLPLGLRAHCQPSFSAMLFPKPEASCPGCSQSRLGQPTSLQQACTGVCESASSTFFSRVFMYVIFLAIIILNASCKSARKRSEVVMHFVPWWGSGRMPIIQYWQTRARLFAKRRVGGLLRAGKDSAEVYFARRAHLSRKGKGKRDEGGG